MWRRHKWATPGMPSTHRVGRRAAVLQSWPPASVRWQLEPTLADRSACRQAQRESPLSSRLSDVAARTERSPSTGRVTIPALWPEVRPMRPYCSVTWPASTSTIQLRLPVPRFRLTGTPWQLRVDSHRSPAADSASPVKVSTNCRRRWAHCSPRSRTPSSHSGAP